MSSTESQEQILPALDSDLWQGTLKYLTIGTAELQPSAKRPSSGVLARTLLQQSSDSQICIFAEARRLWPCGA